MDSAERRTPWVSGGNDRLGMTGQAPGRQEKARGLAE